MGSWECSGDILSLLKMIQSMTGTRLSQHAPCPGLVACWSGHLSFHFPSWMAPNIQNKAQRQGNPGTGTRWQLTPWEKRSLIFSRVFDLGVYIRILDSGLTTIAKNIGTYSFGCKTKINVLLKDRDIETPHVGVVGEQIKFSVGKAAHNTLTQIN